jgi:PPOX class probable F420-dependent enzyme
MTDTLPLPSDRSCRLAGHRAERKMILPGRFVRVWEMRTHLRLEDLGSFLGEPRVAVLATLRRDGAVLLSPVWHEWRDGGFNTWMVAEDVKVRHLRRDPRATIVVAESEPPLRGVEVRGSAALIDAGVPETAVRIAARYIGAEKGTAYVASLPGEHLIVRLTPGAIRAWDFADEYD